MPPSDILIFGEDHNDCVALMHLVKALLPQGVKPNVRPMKRPIVLAKKTSQRKREKMSVEISQFARGFEKAGKKVTVVTHRDCDAVEPAHLEQAKQLETDLKSSGVKSVVAATPAWEIESWWMLFPRAIRETRPSWREVDYGTAHVGSIANAKDRLRRDLRPTDKRGCRDFHESDGARIAEQVAKDRSHLDEVKARSDSFTSFRTKLIESFRE